MAEAVYRPRAPYSLSPHLRLFTLPGSPGPWLVSGGPGGVTVARVLLRLPGGGVAPVEAVFEGEPWEPVVRVRAWGRHAGRAVEAAGLALRVYYDWSLFLEAARRAHPRLAEAALGRPGLRPGRCLWLYAALIDAVVKQRIQLRAALRVYSRLVVDLGPRASVGGRVFYGHPDPEAVVAAGVEGLRRYGLTRAKARALVEVAGAELEGRLPGLREVEEDPWGAARELTRLWGVGPWTAELAVALVHPLFPVGPKSDLAVRRGISMLLGLDPDGPGAQRVIEALGPHAGLAMYILALEYEESRRPGRAGGRA